MALKQRDFARIATSALAAFVASFGTACGESGQGNKPQYNESQDSTNGQQEKKAGKKMSSTATPAKAKNDPKVIELPKPEVKLPEVPYDKDQLPGIRKLDTMIVDAAHLGAAHEIVDGHSQRMKHAANTSLNGTHAEQVRGLLAIIDGLEDFANEGAILAGMARKEFMKKYSSDDEFSTLFREAYSAAEEELNTAIQDNAARRAVSSAMMNSYRQPPRTNLSYLESMVEEGKSLRGKTIDKVVQSAETSMMVADFKKGRSLVDLLTDTRNKLKLVQPLDPKNEKITAILDKVAAKQAERQKEIAEAREATRFPERYSATNAPKNFAEIEESMKKALTETGYKVHDIAIASTWISVRSPLGIHLYNQIDFYVATESKIAEEAKAGVLDILYVTGKTGGQKLDLPFARRSLGSFGQMLKTNL